PERLVASLHDALEILGDVEIAVARELTKMHEEIARGTVSAVLASFEERPRIYGEITIVFGAAAVAQAEVKPEELRAEFERLRATGMRRNDAVKAVAEKFGLRKNEVYPILAE